jgi:hypothetical protein
MSGRDDIVGTLVAFATLGIPTAYIAYQVRLLKRWTGAFWIAALVPLPLWAAWAISLLVALYGDPTSRPLWPLEILAGVCLSGAYLLLLARLRRRRRDRHMALGRQISRRMLGGRLFGDDLGRHARPRLNTGGNGSTDGPA